MGVSGVGALKENLDAVEGRRECFGNAARDAAGHAALCKVRCSVLVIGLIVGNCHSHAV